MAGKFSICTRALKATPVSLFVSPLQPKGFSLILYSKDIKTKFNILSRLSSKSALLTAGTITEE